MKTEKEIEQELNQQIKNWKKSKNKGPLIIEFEDGEKFVFVKDIKKRPAFIV